MTFNSAPANGTLLITTAQLEVDKKNEFVIVDVTQGVVQRSNAVVLGNNADVGIGTSAPRTKLHVAGGRVYVEANGQGLILRSPNGTVCLEITASNTGTLVSAPIPCP